MFYIRTQGVPRSKQSPPRLYKTNLLMSCKAQSLSVLRSVQNTETQCKHHVEFLNIKPGGT